MKKLHVAQYVHTQQVYISMQPGKGVFCSMLSQDKFSQIGWSKITTILGCEYHCNQSYLYVVGEKNILISFTSEIAIRTIKVQCD